MDAEPNHGYTIEMLNPQGGTLCQLYVYGLLQQFVVGAINEGVTIRISDLGPQPPPAGL